MLVESEANKNRDGQKKVKIIRFPLQKEKKRRGGQTSKRWRYANMLSLCMIIHVS